MFYFYYICVLPYVCRLVQAYKNMENPSCIVIDASKSREEVCEDAISEMKKLKILPDNLE